MFCDNLSVYHCINTCKAKKMLLQQCLREVCFIAAVNEFQVRMVHLVSKENHISDLLSRRNRDVSYQNQFFELTNNFALKDSPVPAALFNFIHT